MMSNAVAGLSFYNKQGEVITIDEWGALTLEEKRVGSTQLEKYWVSTVLVGVDMSHDPKGCTPIIFETMVFESTQENRSAKPMTKEWVGALSETYQERYATLAEAEAGHARIVEIITRTGELPQ